MQGAALGIIRSFVPNIAQQAFRDVFAIQWAVGLILILAFAVTPESPVYLINNHQYEKAHKGKRPRRSPCISDQAHQRREPL